MIYCILTNLIFRTLQPLTPITPFSPVSPFSSTNLEVEKVDSEVAKLEIPDILIKNIRRGSSIPIDTSNDSDESRDIQNNYSPKISCNQM